MATVAASSSSKQWLLRYTYSCDWNQRASKQRKRRKKSAQFYYLSCAPLSAACTKYFQQAEFLFRSVGKIDAIESYSKTRFSDEPHSTHFRIFFLDQMKSCWRRCANEEHIAMSRLWNQHWTKSVNTHRCSEWDETQSVAFAECNTGRGVGVKSIEKWISL